jgi:ankyrin repeat protein
MAAYAGRHGVVNLLLQHGADARQCETRTNASPLYIAAWRGHLAVVDSLVMVAPDLVHLPNRLGATPLHAACLNRKTGVVKYLLMVGADAKRPMRDGSLPLDAALRSRSRLVLELIRGELAAESCAQPHGPL